MSSFHQHLRTLTAPSLRKGQWRPDSYNPERIPLKVGAFGQRGSPDPVTTFPLPPTHFPGFLRLGLLPRHPTATLPAAAPTSCLSLKLTHRRHVPPCFLPHPKKKTSIISFSIYSKANRKKWIMVFSGRCVPL